MPVCKSVRAFLRGNLGTRCLGVLTGTDARALDAAVHLVELYSYSPNPEVAQAFGLAVMQMQSCSRPLAYHAIAHVMDWGDRARLWTLAELPGIELPGVCEFEPGGHKGFLTLEGAR